MIKFTASVLLPFQTGPWVKDVEILGPRGLWFWTEPSREPNVVVDLTGGQSDDVRQSELKGE